MLAWLVLLLKLLWEYIIRLCCGEHLTKFVIGVIKKTYFNSWPCVFNNTLSHSLSQSQGDVVCCSSPMVYTIQKEGTRYFTADLSLRMRDNVVGVVSQ